MVCWEYPDDGNMPIWMPPSPPVSDSETDLYCDPCGELWYESEPMSESRLPSTVHELHRPRPITHPPPVPVPNTTLSQLSEVENTTVVPVEPMLSSTAVSDASLPAPMSTPSIVDTITPQKLSLSATPNFERERVNVVPQTGVTTGATYLDTTNLLRPPTPSHGLNSVDDAIDTVRRSHKVPAQRHSHPSSKSSYGENRNTKNEMRRPFTPPPRVNEASDYEGPEWSIIEDRALLMAVTVDQNLPYHLHSSKSGHVTNWEYISAILMRVSGRYRSPRQCSLRYQMIVVPREEGRTIALDPITKKTKKITVSSIELAHMKRGNTTTEQQYAADAARLLSRETLQKFYACKNIVSRNNARSQFSAPPLTSSLDGRLTSAQELKLAECGVRYHSITFPIDLLEYQKETRLKMREQDKEKQRAKDEDDRQKEAATAREQNERDQRVEKRESIFSSLPGMIKYRRASMAFMEETPPHVSAPVCPPSSSSSYPGAGLRTTGNTVHPMQVAASTSGMTAVGSTGEMSQVVVGPRSYSEHQSGTLGGVPGSHHTSTRRVAIQPGSLQTGQHQIVMSGGGQIVQGGGQPYTVVVSQENVLSSTGQPANARIQYSNRSEGVVEQRQAVYRTVSLSAQKRPPSSSPVQRVGLNTGYSTTGTSASSQLYTPTGRTVIVSTQGNEIPALNDQSQLQAMRPQVQSVMSSGQRQEIRPKIAQRTQNRVYITPSGAPTESRSYKFSQGPVRMLASGQRITQKRSSGVLPSRSLSAQPQVTMTVRPGMQPVVNLTRNVSSGYQGGRMPSIGVIMGSSGGRNSETLGSTGASRQISAASSLGGQVVTTGSGVTLPRQYAVNSQGQIARQLPSLSTQSNVTSTTTLRAVPASIVAQDHYGNITVQQTQPLPPISLSSHSNSQRLNPPTPRQSSSLPGTVPSSPMQPQTPNAQCADSLPTTPSGTTSMQ